MFLPGRKGLKKGFGVTPKTSLTPQKGMTKHERPEPHRSTKCARGERQSRTFLAHFGGREGMLSPHEKKLKKEFDVWV